MKFIYSNYVLHTLNVYISYDSAMEFIFTSCVKKIIRGKYETKCTLQNKMACADDLLADLPIS